MAVAGYGPAGGASSPPRRPKAPPITVLLPRVGSLWRLGLRWGWTRSARMQPWTEGARKPSGREQFTAGRQVTDIEGGVHIVAADDRIVATAFRRWPGPRWPLLIGALARRAARAAETDRARAALLTAVSH